MTRRQLVELLYQDPQPDSLIKEQVLSKTEVISCKDKLPDIEGDYLIYHTTYGWCLYGYTAKHRWGTDDEIIRRDGSKLNKVVEWASLKFLEKE